MCMPELSIKELVQRVYSITSLHTTCNLVRKLQCTSMERIYLETGMIAVSVLAFISFSN